LTTPASIEQVHLASNRRLAMFSAALYVIPILWYVRTDLALYAGDWPHLRQRLLSRAAALAGSVLVLAVLPQVRTRKTYDHVVLAYAMWVALFIVVINGLRPQGATLPLRTPLFALFLLYGALPNTFWRQCAPAWLLSVGLVTLRLTWVTSGADGDIGGDIVIVLVVNAFGVAWQAEHEARVASDRTLAELKTLRGIIPICMHCRKVRTQANDWQLLERYVHDHTDAKFSHGLCPGCAAVHCPK
jgi:hypothetical protein